MEAYRLGLQTPLQILRPSYQPPPQHAQRSTPSGCHLSVSQPEHSLPNSRPQPAYTSHFKVASTPAAHAQQPTLHAPHTPLEQSWQGCIMHNSHSCDNSKPASPLHGSQRSASVREETRLSRQAACSLQAATDPTSQDRHQQVGNVDSWLLTRFTCHAACCVQCQSFMCLYASVCNSSLMLCWGGIDAIC